MTRPISPGDLLDHYRIESLVASSAMVFVFRATDTRTGASVAVKVPRRDSGGWFSKSDLERESSIGRAFDHPGIAKVLPSGGSTRRYAVIEWVDGRTLRQIICEEGRLPIRRAIDVVRRICDAVGHIHSRGFVHLDLKPDNVIVDWHDRVKLIDFGVARRTKISLLARAKSNRGGTPDYASPEQIRGKAADARSDIYSLGVILYEMLTGEVPFSGAEPALALNLRLLVDPPHPREANPEIPAQLGDVVQCALARHPARRHASASELAGDLVRVGETLEVEFAQSI